MSQAPGFGSVQAIHRIESLHQVAGIGTLAGAVGIVLSKLHQRVALAGEGITKCVGQPTPSSWVIHRFGDPERCPPLGELFDVGVVQGQRLGVQLLKEVTQPLHPGVEGVTERAVTPVDAVLNIGPGGGLEPECLAFVDLGQGEVGAQNAVKDELAHLGREQVGICGTKERAIGLAEVVQLCLAQRRA